MTFKELQQSVNQAIQVRLKQAPTANSTAESLLTKADITKSQPSIFDIIKQVPAGLADASSKIVSGAIRGEKAVAKSLINTKIGQQVTDEIAKRISGTPTALEKSVNKELFTENTPTITEYGNEVLPKFAQKGPLPFMAGLGLTALDFTGAGGEKSAIKSLVATKDEAQAFKILKQVNVAEDLAKEYAPIIAKATKEADVSKIIAHIDDLQKTTKMAETAKIVDAVKPSLEETKKTALLSEGQTQIAKDIAEQTKLEPQIQIPTPLLLPKEQKNLSSLSGVLSNSEQNLVQKELPQAIKSPPILDSRKNVSSFYNLDKLKINGEAKQAIQSEIDNAGKQLEKTVGRTLSNKEVLNLADNSSKILNKTVTREQTAAKIAADLKLRQQIASVAENGQIDKNFIDLWIKDKSAGEDIARQLQARKINASPKDTQIIDTILQAIYKVNNNADEIAKVAEGVDFNDPKQVTEFYRKFVKPKASEWVDLLRYNSMLSSPNTHIINTASNFEGTGIIAPIEKTITGIIDATRSALTGKPREYAIGEGAAYAKGYYKNIANATKRFVSVMKGERLITQPDIRRIPLATKGASAVMEKTLNYPMRLLEGMDQFFGALTEGGVQAADKYKTSKGIKREVDITAEAQNRLFRGDLHRPDQGKVLNAIDDVTGVIQKLRNSDNPVTSNIAKFTLPFVRTPMEILKQGIEYSPMGVSTLWGATNKTEQLSKIIIGTSVAAGVATILGQDRLTWAQPTNPTQKAAFLSAGRQPYSIKIGNKWVSYSKLHPALAFNFALVAAIDDAQKNKHLDDSQSDTLLSAVAKWANFFADQSYLKNIGDFVAATKGDVGGYAKMISNYPQQLIPFRALMSWVERLTDTAQRQVNTTDPTLDQQVQQIMAQIPGLAQKVPKKTGRFGLPLKNDNKILNSFSPNKITTVNPGMEGLYKLDQIQSRFNRLNKDIKDKINSAIQKKLQRIK